MGQAEVTFQSSGHIPGSVNSLVDLEGKNIWYSGDINTIDTALLKRADPKLPELDMAIIESTYATVEHTPREECEKKLVETANEVVEGRGVALIPAFSVGRSQEILCILQKNRFKYDITIDGMSRTATKMIAGRPEELREPKLLRDAMARSNWIQGQRDRNRALSKPGVIISSSGMLSGGASTRYMEKIKNRSNDAVILVSYQVPGPRESGEGKYGPVWRTRKARRVEWALSHLTAASRASQTLRLKVTPKPRPWRGGLYGLRVKDKRRDRLMIRAEHRQTFTVYRRSGAAAAATFLPAPAGRHERIRIRPGSALFH